MKGLCVLETGILLFLVFITTVQCQNGRYNDHSDKDKYCLSGKNGDSSDSNLCSSGRKDGQGITMTPKYTVTYFNYRWLAEPIRFLLRYVGEDFEDIRVSWEDWVSGLVDKTKYRYSKLPFFTERAENGEVVVELSQSFTIIRYLAKKYNLLGTTIVEQAMCEEYADCLKDILKELEQMNTDDENRKSEVMTELLNKTFPRYFSVFENILFKQQKKLQESSGGFFPLVGTTITWTDFLLAHYTDIFEQFLNVSGGPKGEDGSSTILDDYPTIKTHQRGVFGLEQIKKWIKERPVTPL